MDSDKIDGPICYVSSRSNINMCYVTSDSKTPPEPAEASVFVSELCQILCQYATSDTLHQMQLRLNASLKSSRLQSAFSCSQTKINMCTSLMPGLTTKLYLLIYVAIASY